MKQQTLKLILNYTIAAVWVANGLFCKILNLVPRHQEIVARILGNTYATYITKAIGVSEVCMAVWIVSGIKPRLNVLMQLAIIGTMNILEFILAPDLLLWGHLNLVFAILFCGLIYYNGFVLREKQLQTV